MEAGNRKDPSRDEVVSADGTPIAYEAVGAGPTAVSHDRPGRGGSGDTLPYDVRREVEDIEALIRHFGDRAVLHGISLLRCASSRPPRAPRRHRLAYFMTQAVGQPPEAVDEARMGGDASALPERMLADLTVPVLTVHSTAARCGWRRAPARSRGPCPTVGSSRPPGSSTTCRSTRSRRCSGGSAGAEVLGEEVLDPAPLPRGRRRLRS